LHRNVKVSTLRRVVLARGPGVEICEVLQCCDGVGRGHGKKLHVSRVNEKEDITSNFGQYISGNCYKIPGKKA